MGSSREGEPLTSERLAELVESFRECERLYDETNDYGKMNYGGVGFRRAKAIIPALLSDNDRLHAALAAAEAREAALLAGQALAEQHIAELTAQHDRLYWALESTQEFVVAHAVDTTVGRTIDEFISARLDEVNKAALLAATAEAGEAFACPGCGEHWRRDQLGPTPDILRCPNCGEFCEPADSR